MTRPHPIALLLLSAAVLVAAATWWLTDNPLAAHTPAGGTHIPAAGPPDHSPADPDLEHDRSPPADQPLAALDHDHDEGFSSHDLWDHINDPANSDLPADLFAELAQLGADVVRADATGHGRDQWPHHWATGDGRAQPCCTHITIHAAGAYTHPTHPDAVQVTVIWTGTHPHRDNLIEQTSHIHLHPSPNGWRPR